MPDYKKMYSYLFNAITDALDRFEEGKISAALDRLRDAQRETEEIYLEEAEDEEWFPFHP
ncbi:MAG: hypothetical protein IJE26_06905 [Oscillospiraceae bacterium]|nr:hypothetical protein [Oscillospiraceae bacterium]